ncbi:MAG TPA: tetratricopeptide repeat protein [Allosphingosinicella sp.]|jgi:Flp pilus assembly protein TadD
MKAYVQARAAGSFGASAEAAKAYAAALAATPDSPMLAARAFNEAVAAGDWPLALNSARTLERSGEASADVRLLLLSEALRERDWRRASLHIDALEKDEVFGFMGPVLRAWTAVGSRRGNPFTFLAAGEGNPMASSYAREHRPLLLLAAGQRDQGARELLELTKSGEGLAEQRLRIAGAALLARKGDREAALTLLEGDAPALVKARGLVESRRGVPGEIASAPAGAAEFMVRIAGDLYRQSINDLALRLARIATFLAPENSETWLVTADLLSAQKRQGPALAALDQVKSSDPFAGAVQDTRIKLLLDSGRQQEALVQAQAQASALGATAADWTRLGMLLTELERQNEAALAFDRALQLRGAGEGSQSEWMLRLLKGGALEQAGSWPEAKAELEAAYKLAPEQAIVLNYLGYAQLERRENVEQATRLIEEASRLEPDSAEITDSLGWAYFLRGELPKAIELLERAAAAAPADPEINEHLGDAYYKGGRRFEARYAWKAALLYAQAKDAARLRAKIEAGLTPELASP